MTEERLPLDGGSVGAIWDEARAPFAVAVVAHGAGNRMTHPLLAGIAGAMSAAGVAVLRFNFPYADAGRKAPDRPQVLAAAWRAALAEAGRRAPALPLVATGKSLGGRMASLLAAQEGEAFAARALVFFGYPLHAPSRPDALRDAHLSSVAVPMLFLQGTADPFARLDLLEPVVRRLGPLARLHLVEGGDHSFRVRGRRRRDDEVGRELGEVAAAFVRATVGAAAPGRGGG